MTVGNLVKKSKIHDNSLYLILFTFLIISSLMFFLSARNVYSMEITWVWDEVTEENIVGYRLFYRHEGEVYNYSSPDWEGIDISCTITNLDPNSKYYFVVRAYDSEGNESDNSNEVYYSPTENIPPNANAGSDQTVNEAATVILNGSGSYDTNGSITEYLWEPISDRQITLSDENAIQPTFIAPYVSVAESIIFKLTVTDNEGAQASDFCVVNVTNSVDNLGPLKPVIDSPSNGTTETELMPLIITEPYKDPENDIHNQTHWQISQHQDFSSLSLDIVSSVHLTELTVPQLVLDPDNTYYVRVQFSDGSDTSEWSDIVEFITKAGVIDLNANGIPDEKEVHNYIDMNGDGNDDNTQPDIIKCIKLPDNLTIIGIEKGSDSIVAIDTLDTIDPLNISESTNKPSGLSFGLFSYRLKVDEPGATASVTIYFSKDISDATNFYKFDTIEGWQDYTQNVTFNDDGRSIAITIIDGGFGDSDGIANGVIVDPGGLVTLNSDSSGAKLLDNDNGATNSGGCFISTSEN